VAPASLPEEGLGLGGRVRICVSTASDRVRLQRTRKPPSCKSHDHVLPCRADAAVKDGHFEWVEGKRRAIVPTRFSTDCGYDRAPSLEELTKRPPLGVCRVCGAGSFRAICQRCRLDGISDVSGRAAPTTHRRVQADKETAKSYG